MGKLEGYRKAMEELDERIVATELALGRVVDIGVGRELIERFCERARRRLASFQFQERRQFVRLLVAEIRYFSDARTATVVGHIPADGVLDTSAFTAMDGIPSMASCSRGHYPRLRFQLEVKV